MKPFEERNFLGDISMQDFERAASVDGGVARHHSTERVSNATLTAFPPRVFTLGPNTDNQRILFGVFKQEFKVFWVSLKISVYISDQWRSRVVNACLDGSTESTVALEGNVVEVRAVGAHSLD